MSRLGLFLKAAIIAFISVLLLIPLNMIQGTVSERNRYRQEAVDSVARSYAGAQSLQPPVLVVPYRVEHSVTHIDDRGLSRVSTEIRNRQWRFFPSNVDLRGSLAPAIKRRGLHQVRVYELTAAMNGDFQVVVPDSLNDGVLLDLGKPYLSFGIADVRGLVGSPELVLDQKPQLFSQAAAPSGAGPGLHVVTAQLVPGEKRNLRFRMTLVLGGTESFAFVPLADNNHVELVSTWPHPNFGGQYSPRNPKISDKGFHARWDITALASGAQSRYQEFALASVATGARQDGEETAVSANVAADSLNLTLVDPVNIYTQADRASKYGFLFVMLTFVGFLMFELIKRLAIHPIQYGLVGLALAIFFLLLLSLSEHVAFWQAYLVASIACISLLAVYLSSVLRSRVRGGGFAAMLTLLYATLYGLLVSEDNALVLGSLMLFVILAVIMLITRKIDWYGLSASNVPTPGAPPPLVGTHTVEPSR